MAGVIRLANTGGGQSTISGSASTNQTFILPAQGGTISVGGGASAGTLQEVTDNGNTTTGEIFVGSGIRVGRGAGDVDTNTVVGSGALANNTADGDFNTAIGRDALATNTSGSFNTAVGSNALENNTADNNTAVGLSALNANTSGSRNTAVGRSALATNTSGDNNTALGHAALVSNTTGATNTAVGRDALRLNETGSNNVAVGFEALQANTVGGNTAVGSSALLANISGSSNVAIGLSALEDNTEGGLNVAIGANALQANTSGDFNTACGANSLLENTVGERNTAVGRSALQNSTSSDNTCVGMQAGNALTSGGSNTILGRLTGFAGMANTMLFGAGNNERFRVTDSGNFQLGGTLGTTPKIELIDDTGAGNVDTIDLNNPVTGGLGNRIASFRNLVLAADKNNGRGTDASNIIFETDASEFGRITGANQLLIGGATAAREVGGGFQAAEIQIETAGEVRAGQSITWNNDADGNGPHLAFGRSRSDTLTGVDTPSQGDTYGDIWAFGADGVDMHTPATRIRFWTGAGTPARNKMPGAISFFTSNITGDDAPERIRIGNDGRLTLISSPGIQFGATNSGTNITSQTLDDYEEGTWTPELVSNSNTFNHTIQSGTYTKVGHTVTASANIEVELTAIGGANGQVTCSLPFDTRSNATTVTPVRVTSGGALFGAEQGLAPGQRNYISVKGNTPATTVPSLWMGNASTNFYPSGTAVRLQFEVTYQTNA